MHFATYLHAETCLTSKAVTPDLFIGHGYPHYSEFRRLLADALAAYPQLPLCTESGSNHCEPGTACGSGASSSGSRGRSIDG